jgi:hypothetical protein
MIGALHEDFLHVFHQTLEPRLIVFGRLASREQEHGTPIDQGGRPEIRISF